MNLLPGLTWLTSMASRRSPADDDAPDPADMGTAFGLDASMESEPGETSPKPGPTPQPPADRLVRRPRR
jgi:hypothetical protein